MTTGDPSQHLFWLASRALGIVAIALLGVSVALGLAQSGRLLRPPGLPAKLKRFHEASTLVVLGLVVAHAGVLLGDAYLRPGLAGIALPFQLGYRPLWTGTGVIAGWLALVLGLSFSVRRWIGVKTWRRLHRWTLAVYVLALAHAIGAGTDGRSAWMLVMLALLTAPITVAFTLRMRLRRTPVRVTAARPDAVAALPRDAWVSSPDKERGTHATRDQDRRRDRAVPAGRGGSVATHRSRPAREVPGRPRQDRGGQRGAHALPGPGDRRTGR
jgi:predicted ferric reductase